MSGRDLPLPKGYEYVRPLLDPELTPPPPIEPTKPCGLPGCLDDDVLLQEAYGSGYDAGYLDGYKDGHGDTL